jgi:hypothetical protein
LSALAESLLLYVEHGPVDSIADTPLRELTVMLSVLGLFMAEGDGSIVAVPLVSHPGGSHARYRRQPSRRRSGAAELHRDAMRLRAATTTR